MTEPSSPHAMPTHASQFSSPFVVTPGGSTTKLERVSLSASGVGAHNEDWLQNLLFAHPGLLPIDEIEPTFADGVPLCREIETSVGPLDLLLVNENGLLTLVECKLWRNPEARRKVVGQILDYAQAMSRWTYEDLDQAVRRATREPALSLWERVRTPLGLTDEAVFVDRVTRHIRDSTFLLLIVGDGIRENTEQIGDYLKKYAGLSFTLGLVEQQLYALPDGGLLVQPRTLAKTVELGRVVVKIDGAGRIAETPPAIASETEPTTPVPRTLTEQIFIEEAAGTSQLGVRLQAFFDQAKRAGFLILSTAGGRSLKICTTQQKINLLTLSASGEVRNYGVGSVAGGVAYLEKLAAILTDAKVRVASNGFSSTVVKSDGDSLDLESLLDHGDAVLQLMTDAAPLLETASLAAPGPLE